jgi:nucleotide-binding universal stress UspA family protein
MTDGDAFAERVVAGFDGSPSGSIATTWAAEQARLLGRGLTLVHALMPPVATGGLGVSLPPSLDLLEELENQARAQLEDEARRIGAPEARTKIAVGSPSAVMLEASETAHLVVVGSRGRGGFKGLLLGSVSAQVAAHSQCPIAVIREAPTDTANTVVVGIDGSPGAEFALAFAFDQASRRRWRIVAVHAWDVPAYDLLIVPNGPVPIPLSNVADEEVRLTAEVLAGLRDDFPDVEVEERLVRAPAVQAILEASEGSGLIVVGTHGHGPTMGALLGSVSNGVLHKAHVPVVVVPPHEPERSAA